MSLKTVIICVTNLVWATWFIVYVYLHYAPARRWDNLTVSMTIALVSGTIALIFWDAPAHREDKLTVVLVPVTGVMSLTFSVVSGTMTKSVTLVLVIGTNWRVSMMVALVSVTVGSSLTLCV